MSAQRRWLCAFLCDFVKETKKTLVFLKKFKKVLTFRKVSGIIKKSSGRGKSPGGENKIWPVGEAA